MASPFDQGFSKIDKASGEFLGEAEASSETVDSALGEVVLKATSQSKQHETAVTLPSADAVPSLLPALERIASYHEHRYSQNDTVYASARLARQTDEQDRTPEQHSVLDDMTHMRRFAPYSSLYEDIFTPAELHGLVAELNLLSYKHRPDFNGVEGRALDIVISSLHTYDTADFVPASIRSIALRAEQSAGKRRGMQWDTLVKVAAAASDIITTRTGQGFDTDYSIAVQDPEPNTLPDLSKVYQFVADAYALEVIGQRRTAVHQTRLETFEANCTAVNEWYERAAPILAQLPSSFKINRYAAWFEVRTLVDSMNTRLTGKQDHGYGKDYRLDPAGAISLQKKIGHAVEAIKSRLTASEAGEIDETEIVPLE